MFAENLPIWRVSESRRKVTVGDRRMIMNLKAYLPIIALCGLTFAVSFAAGLWWEMSQQEEWAESDTQQSLAKRKAVTEKPKSDDEKSNAEEENVAADKKDEPDTPAEDAESRPSETTPEPVVAPNVSPAGPPANAKRIRGGVMLRDLSNIPEEQRVKIMEARQRALEYAARAQEAAAVEISDESESTIDISGEGTPDGGVIIIEPDN